MSILEDVDSHYPTTLDVNELDKYFIWYDYYSSPSQMCVTLLIKT